MGCARCWRGCQSRLKLLYVFQNGAKNTQTADINVDVFHHKDATKKTMRLGHVCALHLCIQEMHTRAHHRLIIVLRVYCMLIR